MTRLGELIGCAVAGVVGALIVIVAASPPSPPPEPTPVTGELDAGTSSPPAEDEPGWNCLTMGNLECGPEWAPLTAEQIQEITRSHAGYDDWQGCLTDQVTVVCDDDYVYEWVKVPTDYAA